jgi:hypothetical protein
MAVRTTAAVALLLSSVLLAGCSSGPDAAVKGFYKALDKGELTAAKGYLSKQITDMLGDAKLEMALGEGSKNIAQCGGLDGVDVTLSGEGETRRGTAVISFKGDCPQKNDDVMLVQEDGDWKIGIGK